MSQHDYRGGHEGGGQYYGQVAPPPRNGMGTTALVLGIVGIPLALIPFIGFVGLICGLVGLVLGAIGMRRAKKGAATNFKTSLWGTILSIGAVVVSIAIWVSFSTAVSTAVGTGGPSLGTATAVGPGNGEPRSDFAIGETADLEGLLITVGTLSKVGGIGGPHLCTELNFVNQRDGEEAFNMSSWKLQAPGGQIGNAQLTGDKADLVAGGVASGGKASGRVCFEDPKTPGEYTVIYEVNMFSEEQVRWRGNR